MSGAGGEELVQTSKLLFAGGVSPTQSPTGAVASLCSQALNTLALEVQLLPQSFFVLRHATDRRDGAMCRI